MWKGGRLSPSSAPALPPGCPHKARECRALSERLEETGEAFSSPFRESVRKGDPRAAGCRRAGLGHGPGRLQDRVGAELKPWLICFSTEHIAAAPPVPGTRSAAELNTWLLLLSHFKI